MKKDINKILSDLFENYYRYFCNPWDFDENMIKDEKKAFITAFKTGIDTDLYIDYATDIIKESSFDEDIITMVNILEKMTNYKKGVI